MLAKHIKPKAEGGKIPHYNYAGLAHYIADTKNDGKKLHDSWMVNCVAGGSRESLVGAIAEIKPTQKQNTRATSDKSYHLMITFIPAKKTQCPLRRLYEILRGALQRLLALRIMKGWSVSTRTQTIPTCT